MAAEDQVNVVQEAVPAFGQLQIRPLVAAERQAALEREVSTHNAKLEREQKENNAQLERDKMEGEHRRRIDMIGFSVLVAVLLVGFVCGLLPSEMVGDQKWAQSIASAVLGLMIGRYTISRKH